MPVRGTLEDQILSLRQLGLDAGLNEAVDFLVNHDLREKYQGEVSNYFADVLAATAYDLLSKKSTGKNERNRQISICKHAISALRNGHLSERRGRPTLNVVERLEKILKEFESCES